MSFRRNLFFVLLLFISISVSAQTFRLAHTLTDNIPPATNLTLTLDGSFLAEGDEEGNIAFRNADNGTVMNKSPAHSQAVNSLNFDSTGRLLVSTSLNGEIRIYDFATWQIRNRYKSAGEGMRFALFSIADGFIYFNNNERLWKIRSDFNRDAEEAFVSPEAITSAVILPDRSALIFSAGKYVNVMNTRNDM